jgi:NAD(P)-dependent dehydrogenase (short-subunit alcohol dehydrogenase family)
MLRYKAIARAWAQAGAAGIVLVGRSIDTLNLTVDNISKINKSIPVVAEATDVSNESSVKSLFAKVKAKFGKAHVLINSAATMASGKIGDILPGSWWSNYVRILKDSPRKTSNI